MHHSKQKIHRVRLKSGATLVHIVADLPYTVVSYWVNAGSRFDPKRKEGLSHFFEHLFMEQTKDYSDRMMRLAAIESKGIYFNAYTRTEGACYLHVQLPQYTQESLDLLIDGVSSTFFSKKRIDQERQVILEELANTDDDPRECLAQISGEALWPGSKLGHSVLGTKASLKSIRLQDIEEFKAAYYTAMNSCFVVISPDKTADIKKRIDASLVLPKGKQQGLHEKFKSPVSLTQLFRQAGQETVGVNFRVPGLKSQKEIMVLDLIREYLSDHWTARLMKRLRMEHDLVYWVDGYSTQYSDTGFLRLTFSTKPVSVQKALDLVFEEIQSLHENFLPDQELKNTKTFFTSGLIRSLQNPVELLWWYAWPSLLGGAVKTPDEYVKAINSITPEEIRAVSKKYLTKENLAIVLIGPKSKQKIRISL